jgi:diguanylate cyclase (GGDEF)-like protein/PAS domain S-box-containing protein
VVDGHDEGGQGARQASDPRGPAPGPVPWLSAEGLADPVLALDLAGQLLYANDAASQVLGWDAAGLRGTPVLQLVHPDDVNLATSALATVVTKPFGDLLTLRVRTGHGTWRYLELRGTFHPDSIVSSSDGDALDGSIVIVARDVTERHRLEFDQGDIQVLRSVMANMHGMVVLADAMGRVRSINGAVTRLLGYDPDSAKGRSILDALHPDDREQVIDAAQSLGPQSSVTLDARILRADAEPLICEFSISNLLDDPVVNSYVISAQVATALADARERVDFLAHHDGRTGLLNRDGFMRSAATMMQAGGGLGILILDIVHFRSVNELYGEPVGDAVLRAIADRLDRIRWPDLVTARFGGDEFVLAVRGANLETVEMLRQRVTRDVARPLVVEGQEVNFQIRTAVAFEARPTVLDALLVSASNDLMSAKRFADPNSGGISVDAINQRRQQVDQLRRALDAGEIQPHYQPICNAEGWITAVEALARWVHPVRGVLGTSEVLPLAQLAGLAEAVDNCVIEQAFAFAAHLDEVGHGDIEVHINVDPKVLSRADFATTLLDRCHRNGAAATQLVVEITETDLLAPSATALANMQKLRFAGIHVAIDDFGTGYSSLAHLLELPIDGVKIDRRFVAGLDVDPAATNLTTAIIGLSESLKLSCVAEGVEQPYQRDRLVELGCRAFQGWLFAPAMTGAELLSALTHQDGKPPGSPDQLSQRSPR